ncbi:MAG: ATP-binding protein [Elainellaceae cyanobacterium]
MLSLRTKLLLTFSLAFSLVFAGAFYWFYTFTTNQVMFRLRDDMRSTLRGAATGVDVQELMALYKTGNANAAGFSDDPRYHSQLEWFETVHDLEPRAWLYSFTVGQSETNRRAGSMVVEPGEPEVIYLVDLWSRYNPAKAARFLQSDYISPEVRRVIKQGRLIEEPTIYTDDWGSWISAFMPLRNDQGKIVAVLGLDIEADYVLQIQHVIRRRILVSFALTYAGLLVLIDLLSGMLTRRLHKFTESAKRIADGDYDEGLALLDSGALTDEISVLAHAFENMIAGIRDREHQIIEGKRIEDEMRQTLQVEKELNDLQSRFISMVSHEFRTPLTVIRTSIEILEHYGHRATPEKRREYFRRICGAIANMNRLLEDIFAIETSDSSRLEFNLVQINLNQFCRDLVEEIRLDETSHRQTIAFISRGDCSCTYVDPTLLRSIVTNLLSNAVKYSPANSTIDFELSCDGHMAVLIVRDRGIGIPKDDQPRLFEIFHRAKNVDAIRGTGLGLAIVKQCVTHHHGHISFFSQEGIGTTFQVSIPISPSEAGRIRPIDG